MSNGKLSQFGSGLFLYAVIIGGKSSFVRDIKWLRNLRQRTNPTKAIKTTAETSCEFFYAKL
jgi:hypothetical protein